ncbi:alkanesulfonate monooxygenase SsuD/methylene tetrahydromethanopterin reductase-like flavin-dependent oxidoreductase (luciferase family) [Kineococcus radiotolerans]|uniref:Monooxygenase n=2 Tax=Kineococcus radiotolerans TaxID=131568 RepID=A6W6I1_KINRD|nr:LLM class flavin-dependent oxidoreductase [Kineococcus radiotolerans]ABS02420.1 putative monooxygenase [Kineococcus radiotolerans SRS30216 = ATCC BAA-149]MBB2900388.1 alkanesulfonate monooxygenase SsuD/methylene tetrahydromethanopterin reductase-like flavin-dependent oxidoreductase (luciferase family) [Kineococcus radiotolerans]
MPTPFHVFLDVDGGGWHPAAWRRSRVTPDAVLSPARLREFAVTAQAQGLTGLTFEDAAAPDPRNPVGHLDAVQRAAFLAGTTDAIGLLPVAATTYAEPFHVAAQIASLDHSSAGRAGWLATTSPAAVARAVDLPVAPDPAAELADVVRAVRALWDSWEDDAVVRDVATGRYVDRDRLHHVDVETAGWSVKGPLTVPRPPQGQPVVVVHERDLSGAPGTADVVLTGDERTRRSAGGPLVVLDVELALDTDAAPGAERVAALDADAPAPVRDRVRWTGSGEGFARYLCGLAGSFDGVRLHAAVLDEDLRALLRTTLPALRVARLLQPPLPGSTLRTTLGLTRPANRFATT